MKMAAVLLACIGSSAAAQSVMPCDWQARADSIVEPWEDNSRSFANGAVRLALLDTIEPAAGAFYLLILHPPLDEVGARRCTVIGRTGQLGYAALFFDALEAGYVPAQGLTFTLPGVIYLPEEGFQNSTLLKITVNQATGGVTASQALGRE